MRSEYDFSRGKRGPVIPVPKGKTRITIRLDKDLIDWFRSQVEDAGGGNYQTLINSALKEYLRGTSSQIAENVARYGRDSVIDEFGPMNSKARARWSKAKRKGGDNSKKKNAKLVSLNVERGLLSRSDYLAQDLGVSRAELIERGLKAVLAAEGKL